jgi:hemoglobin
MANLDEQQIANLVSMFYGLARAHPQLGPVFSATVVDWDHHLQVIRDFWSQALLGTKRYQRLPYPAHVGLPIRREHFGQWLGLFRNAAHQTLPPEAAVRAIARAELMTRSFRAGLFPLDPPEILQAAEAAPRGGAEHPPTGLKPS